MDVLIQKLQQFCKDHGLLMVVNTATDKALICLNPVFEIQDKIVFMKFESLNDRGGNSIFIKAIQGNENNGIFLENEEGNILLLKEIDIPYYRAYIEKQYANAPAIVSIDELKKYLASRND